MSSEYPTYGPQPVRPFGPEPAPPAVRPRSRHAFDPIPLVVGVVFVVTGVTYLAADLRGQDVHEVVLGSVLVAVLALTAFVAIVRGLVRRMR
jgi:hypothetical protein